MQKNQPQSNSCSPPSSMNPITSATVTASSPLPAAPVRDCASNTRLSNCRSPNMLNGTLAPAVPAKRNANSCPRACVTIKRRKKMGGGRHLWHHGHLRNFKTLRTAFFLMRWLISADVLLAGHELRSSPLLLNWRKKNISRNSHAQARQVMRLLA